MEKTNSLFSELPAAALWVLARCILFVNGTALTSFCIAFRTDFLLTHSFKRNTAFLFLFLTYTLQADHNTKLLFLFHFTFTVLAGVILLTQQSIVLLDFLLIQIHSWCIILLSCLNWCRVSFVGEVQSRKKRL